MHKEKSCKFVNFLERTDTEESRKEKLSHELIVSALESRLENIIEEINYVIITSWPQIHDDGTSGKNVNQVIKLEIFFFKVNIHFQPKSQSKAWIYQKKEAELKKQKSKLKEEEQKRIAETTRKSTDSETDLQLLCSQKEKDAVDAELQAMVEFVESDCIWDPELDIIDSREQTRRYVDDAYFYWK